LKLETLAQTWLAWFTATGFAYKHYDTISIIHISRTRAGLKLGGLRMKEIDELDVYRLSENL